MRTVAIVGFSRLSNQAVFDGLPDDIEIWTVNHAHKFDWKIAKLLEVHTIEYISDPHYYTEEVRQQHLNFLHSKKTCQVLMQGEHSNIPSSVAYPLLDALRLTRGRKRFRSSFDWLAALAILEGVDRVEIYGFDMPMNTEYMEQKPSALYWIGRMEGAGIDVDIDENSTLFPDAGLYGYERTNMVTRGTLEAQKTKLKKKYETKQAQLHRWEGILQDRTSHGGGMREAQEQIRNYELQVSKVDGALQIINQLIDQCDIKE